MKYILDSSGYVENASCNPISCNDKVSQEYTGSIPSGYDSLDDWILNANIRAYKITSGNLVYDSARDAALQAEWAKTQHFNAYSTTETLIGTWIDGKPLYRKVFRTTFPTISTNGTYVPNKEVWFADNVDFSFLESIFIENGDQRQSLPYINNSGYISKGFVQGGLLMLTGNSTAHSGKQTTAIILYTKTTD